MVRFGKSSKRSTFSLGVAVLALVALVAVSYAAAGSERRQAPVAKGPGFGTLTTKQAQEARASVPLDTKVPNFGNITLTVMGDAGHNMNPFNFWAPEFKKAGINIKVIEVPFAEVYSKEKAEFIARTNAVDLVVFYPAYIGDFASNGYLEPLDGYFKKYNPHLDDVIKAFRKLYLGWEGKTYALPFDGDVHMLIYRKDLLNNKAEQAAFKQKYGRALTVPATWSEYLQVGQFFTRKAGDTLAGKTLERPFYGCAEYGQRGFSWAWFMNRFASAGGVYFDAQMKPQIDTPAAVRALENMKTAVKSCSPPDVLNYGYDQLRDLLINGDGFMVVQWTDVPKKGADPAQSKVVGKLGYSVLPGTRTGGRIVTRSMMPVGRVLAVTKNSKNKDAAAWVAKYLSYDKSLFDVSTALDGLDPYRTSHINPSAYKMFTSKSDAAAYLNTVGRVLKVGFPEIYIPGAAQYEDALDLAVNKVLAGQASPKDALAQAADQWNQITDRLDRKRQVKLWQSALETYAELGLYKKR